MSAIGIDDIEGLLGVAQYEEEGEFPVEQGYVWTSCSSVENGNPLFWDPAVAEEVTGGPIAPPTMVLSLMTASGSPRPSFRSKWICRGSPGVERSGAQ